MPEKPYPEEVDLLIDIYRTLCGMRQDYSIFAGKDRDVPSPPQDKLVAHIVSISCVLGRQGIDVQKEIEDVGPKES